MQYEGVSVYDMRRIVYTVHTWTWVGRWHISQALAKGVGEGIGLCTVTRYTLVEGRTPEALALTATLGTRGMGAGSRALCDGHWERVGGEEDGRGERRVESNASRDTSPK